MSPIFLAIDPAGWLPLLLLRRMALSFVSMLYTVVAKKCG